MNTPKYDCVDNGDSHIISPLRKGLSVAIIGLTSFALVTACSVSRSSGYVVANNGSFSTPEATQTLVPSPTPDYSVLSVGQHVKVKVGASCELNGNDLAYSLHAFESNPDGYDAKFEGTNPIVGEGQDVDGINTYNGFYPVNGVFFGPIRTGDGMSKSGTTVSQQMVEIHTNGANCDNTKANLEECEIKGIDSAKGHLNVVCKGINIDAGQLVSINN